MLHRFSRMELVIGQAGIKKLATATVAIFGIGGVGAAAAEALARGGIGHLVLIDHDEVQLTNINRQLIALESTLGHKKVAVMGERIAQINPDCQVTAFDQYYESQNATQLLSVEYSAVVDAIDSVTSKLDLIERCYRQGIPIISAMGAGNKLDPTKLQIADISKTHTCPLAKVVRLELRKRGIKRGVQTVFSDEQLEIASEAKLASAVAQENPQRRSIPGSTSVVPPVAGFIMASFVIRKILGEE